MINEQEAELLLW